MRAMSAWAVAPSYGDAERARSGRRPGGQAQARQLGQQRVAVVGVEHERPIEQAALQLVGRPDDRDAAVVDDADAVGVLGLVEVVGREEDGRAVRVADLAQVVPQAAAADRVQARTSARRGTAPPGRCMRLRMISSLRFMPPGERPERLDDVVAEADDCGELARRGRRYSAGIAR